MIAELQVGLAEADAAVVANVVHKLKSASGNLGANALAELCLRLESHARASDLAPAPPLVSKIAAEYERVQAALTLLQSR